MAGWLAEDSKGIRICAPHTCVPKLRSGLWRPLCVVSLRLSKHVWGEIELARDRGRDLWRAILHLLDAHPGTPRQVCFRCPQRRRQWRRCNSLLYMIFSWQFSCSELVLLSLGFTRNHHLVTDERLMETHVLHMWLDMAFIVYDVFITVQFSRN